MKPKILITGLAPQAAIDMLRQAGEVELNPDPEHPWSRKELLERVARNDFLYTNPGNRIDAEFMDANPKIKVIAQMAVGYDNIDIPAATARGIPVTHTPGVLTETTADAAWVLMMSVARRIVEADRFMRSEKATEWKPNRFMGSDIHGKTLGIIGFGRIGKAMARRARGFDMNVIYYDAIKASPTEEDALAATFRPFDDLLREADFVTIHTLYSPSTHHLIDERALSLMKRSAFLVNAARGPIVDEKALVRALQSGQIAGAALDVFEQEPLVEPELRNMENVVLVPHIGSATPETRQATGVLAAQNLIAVIEGRRPPNLINPQVWPKVD